MADVKHSHLIAKMQGVADAHHGLHVHVHLIANAPPPEAPAVKLPTAGAPVKKGR